MPLALGVAPSCHTVGRSEIGIEFDRPTWSPNRKIPSGVMAWEAGEASTLPWGLAGLNVEKDRHEKLWQKLTFRARC